jgi:hypothetical protein
MLIPFVKNCILVVVFPTPLEPVISTVLPTGIPPFNSISNSLIPVLQRGLISIGFLPHPANNK